MLKALIKLLLHKCGYIPIAQFEAAQAQARKVIAEERARLASEQSRHNETRIERNDARAFIDKKLQDLARLEPVVRWPKLDDQPRYLSLESFDLARARVTQFIEGKRRDVIIAVAIPAIFDYWNFQQDKRAVNEAIEYVSKAAAHKISSTLRFGLTGDRS